MRVAAAAATFALLLAAPASAHTGLRPVRVTYEASPCAVACPRFHPTSVSDPCAYPFPPGTYDEVSVEMPPAPEGRFVVLEATIDLTIDWDLYLCGEDGRLLDDSETGVLLELCDNTVGTGHETIGCHEDVSGVAPAGEILTLRAFNVADPGHAIGQYWFTTI